LGVVHTSILCFLQEAGDLRGERGQANRKRIAHEGAATQRGGSARSRSGQKDPPTKKERKHIPIEEERRP
jgi:hypothetical protein